MSLLLIKEPPIQKLKRAGDLRPGTWFIDREGQIYVIVIDDRTDEKRMLCVGFAHKPFIVKGSLRDFDVKKILPSGTLLQITTNIINGGNNE